MNESRNIYLDNNSGDPKKSLMLSVEFDKDFQVNDFVNYIIILDSQKFSKKINSSK